MKGEACCKKESGGRGRGSERLRASPRILTPTPPSSNPRGPVGISRSRQKKDIDKNARANETFTCPEGRISQLNKGEKVTMYSN